MAGGTFTIFNKVRAGAYINVIPKPKHNAIGLSGRGRLAVLLARPKPQELNTPFYKLKRIDFFANKSIFGDFDLPENTVIRAAFANTEEVLFGFYYKLGVDSKAKATETLFDTGISLDGSKATILKKLKDKHFVFSPGFPDNADANLAVYVKAIDGILLNKKEERVYYKFKFKQTTSTDYSFSNIENIVDKLIELISKDEFFPSVEVTWKLGQNGTEIKENYDSILNLLNGFAFLNGKPLLRLVLGTKDNKETPHQDLGYITEAGLKERFSNLDALSFTYLINFVDLAFSQNKIGQLNGTYTNFKDFSQGRTPASLEVQPLLEGLKNLIFDTLAVEYVSDIEHQEEREKTNKQIIQFIKQQRENEGIKIQAVIYDPEQVPVHYEGIICTKQGFSTRTELISKSIFPVFVASLTAGARANESLTSYVIKDAIQILGQLNGSQIEQDILNGYFLLSFRRDGKIKVEQDINTVNDFDGKTAVYGYHKNRVIRTVDTLCNSIVDLYESNFEGKENNNETGRLTLKTAIGDICNELQQINALQDFNPIKDIDVTEGNQSDSVNIQLDVKPVDSIEKIYITLNVIL